MKTIVVSAVNLNRGGTLTILRECLAHLSRLAQTEHYRVVALVYQKEPVYYPGIEYMELQWPKKSWINRLWCEYVTMKKISEELAPVFLWVSLHDTTPTVAAQRRVVYCHNSFPFYRWRLQELFFAPKVVLFALFSKYAYRTNIGKNNYLVVQQQWFRQALTALFGLDEKKIIVAPPSVTPTEVNAPISRSKKDGTYRFFYAAAADSHKNFECICRAARILEKTIGKGKFEVCLTLKGHENVYARWLYLLWGRKVSSLRWVGYLDKESLYNRYAECDCLIFPSKVETWGLPITEFAAFNKPMLLADLPYAHETAAGCEKVHFFNPESCWMLATAMKQLIEGHAGLLKEADAVVPPPPVANSWEELFNKLLE